MVKRSARGKRRTKRRGSKVARVRVTTRRQSRTRIRSTSRKRRVRRTGKTQKRRASRRRVSRMKMRGGSWFKRSPKSPPPSALRTLKDCIPMIVDFANVQDTRAPTAPGFELNQTGMMYDASLRLAGHNMLRIYICNNLHPTTRTEWEKSIKDSSGMSDSENPVTFPFEPFQFNDVNMFEQLTTMIDTHAYQNIGIWIVIGNNSAESDDILQLVLLDHLLNYYKKQVTVLPVANSRSGQVQLPTINKDFVYLVTNDTMGKAYPCISKGRTTVCIEVGRDILKTSSHVYNANELYQSIRRHLPASARSGTPADVVYHHIDPGLIHRVLSPVTNTTGAQPISQWEKFIKVLSKIQESPRRIMRERVRGILGELFIVKLIGIKKRQGGQYSANISATTVAYVVSTIKYIADYVYPSLLGETESMTPGRSAVQDLPLEPGGPLHRQTAAERYRDGTSYFSWATPAEMAMDRRLSEMSDPERTEFRLDAFDDFGNPTSTSSSSSPPPEPIDFPPPPPPEPEPAPDEFPPPDPSRYEEHRYSPAANRARSPGAPPREHHGGRGYDQGGY